MTDTAPDRIELKLPLDGDELQKLSQYVDSSILMRLAELHDGQSSEALTDIVIESLPSDKDIFGAMSSGRVVQARIKLNEYVEVALQMISSQDVEDSARRAIKAADGNTMLYGQLNSRWQLAHGLLSINGQPDAMVPSLPIFPDGEQVKVYQATREKHVQAMFQHIARLPSSLVSLLSTAQSVFEREVGNRIRKMNIEETVGNSTRTPKSSSAP